MPIIKYIIAAVIIVFIRLGYDIIRIRGLIRIGKGFSSRAVSYQQHPPNPTSRILILGDSTGVGSGCESPELSTAGRLGHDYPTADITNLAKNGARIADVATVISGLTGHYDLILIQAGANNITHNTTQADFSRDLTTVLTRAAQLSEHVIALNCGNMGLAPIFPFYAKWFYAAGSRRVRSVYKKIAPVHHTIYIDLYTNKTTDPFYPDYAKFYAGDSFHLNEEGYGIWYQKIRRAMEENNFPKF